MTYGLVIMETPTTVGLMVRILAIVMFMVYPIGSMYGIYANILGILMVNVTIYGIHTDPMDIYIYN